MHPATDYLLFIGKGITSVILIFIALAGILAIAARAKQKAGSSPGQLVITSLSKHYQKLCQQLNESILPKEALKHWTKSQNKLKKQQLKQPRPRLFVIDFEGDIRASSVGTLSRCIDTIILGHQTNDEVLLRLNSPGGMVNHYGLAATELARLRQANIPLTIAVDKMAASGGYMMACVANQIIAADFAIIGSIGVVMQLPNIHRWLEKRDIDVEQLTAGEYKRTLTLIGKNTKEGRAKVQSDIDETHKLFQQFITQFRPQVNIQEVATGEHWFGQQCINKQLIDHLQTSADYLLAQRDHFDLYHLTFKCKQKLLKKLTKQSAQWSNILWRWWQQSGRDR